MNVLYLIIVLMFGISCRNDHENSKLKAIIGAGKFLPIEDRADQISPDLLANLSAIGTLDDECTVFHVGDGIVVTAGHCFPDEQLGGMPCISNRIRWSDNTISQCVEVLHKENTDANDMAIFEVDPMPSGALKIDPNFESGSLSVIGYPKGDGLKISFDCELHQSRNSLEDEGRIFHNCDSLPGNSGSPIFSANSWSVIGIHNGFSDELNYGTSLDGWMDHKIQSEIMRQSRSQALGKIIGPFANNEQLLIQYFPSHLLNIKVDFEMDIEDGYDFVKIIDKKGIIKSYTGQKAFQMELETPAIITFESDYAGSSDHIHIVQVP